MYTMSKMQEAFSNAHFGVMTQVDIFDFFRARGERSMESRLKSYVPQTPHGFDFALFNNPHAGDDRDLNKRLMKQFFAVCKAVSKFCVITLAKPEVHYQQWRLAESAAEAGFTKICQRPLFPSAYPEYTPVYGDNRDKYRRKLRIYYTANPMTYVYMVKK